jgi:hypothetical protein
MSKAELAQRIVQEPELLFQPVRFFERTHANDEIRESVQRADSNGEALSR